MKTTTTIMMILGMMISNIGAAANLEQICTAVIKDESGAVVLSTTESGLKWMAAKNALASCADAASLVDLDPSLCQIDTCEFVDNGSVED